MLAIPTASASAEPASRARRRTLLALAIAAAIYGYQLFVPPIVGMTDTGDFHRSLAPAGLAYPRGWGFEQRRAGFNRHFDLVEPRYVNRTGQERDDIYVASEVLLLHVARGVNAVLAKRGTFDITSAGLVHAAAMLAGLGLVFSAAGRLLSPPAHVVLLASTVFVFTDVGYAAWFNSLYGEPGSLVFLALCLGIGLQAAIAPRPGRWIAAFVLSAALFATAKAQNLGLVLPLAMLALRLATPAPRRARFALALGVAALLALAPLVYSVTPPRDLRRTGLYQTVFTGLLYSSPDPFADLAALGLPQEYARYIGIDYWADPRSPREDPEFHATYFPKVNLGKIALYYATHPDRLASMLRTGGTRAFFLRYGYIGNFASGAGMPPLAHSEAFAFWTHWHERLPANLTFLAGALGFATWRLLAAARRADGSPAMRRAAEVLLLLPAVAVLQFGTVMLGEGPWTANRQLFLMNAAFDALLLLGPVALVARFSRRYGFPASRA
ncbi:MAG: hypothetical protein NDJ94_00040 [Vicinamibacteria bacterium]|jgi:hypothetical protein|nr:hypothetical protein [Vicinamibacteria bacterium]